jgi:hypothetical protein
MSRRRLLGAALDRMRIQAPARDAEEATPAPPPPWRRPPAPPRDAELERLEAEARYHRDRFNLYHARVVSGSSVPTSATRLRELERTATAAAERLAHARASRQRSSS